MNKFGFHLGLAASATKARFSKSVTWFSTLLMLAALLAARTVQAAEEPETIYLRVLSVIEQADNLQANGKNDLAKAKYQQAQRSLVDLKQNHPVFNPKIVAFRLKEVTGKIDALSKPATVTDTTTTTDTKPAVATAPASDEVVVKLLDAGAEPRRTLRIQAKPGDKQKANLIMKMNMDMELGDMPAQSVKMPAITLGMETTVKEVSPDGDVTYDTAMGDVSVAEEEGVLPQVTDAIKASFEEFKGFSGTVTLSSRGLVRGANVKLAGDAPPQARQAMGQIQDAYSTLTAGFPEAAVGKGARWEIRLPLKNQGMTISQTTTYQLASMDGDTINLTSTSTQSAAKQKIENPAMPGLKMDLSKMTGTGTGKLTLNLTRILPSQASMESKSETAMSMNMAGQDQAMTMKMDLKLRLESKE